jgi:hypothetical protein
VASGFTYGMDWATYVVNTNLIDNQK